MSEFLDPVHNVASIGPFQTWPAVVNGYLVPRLQIIDHGGKVEVIYDGRWSLDLPHEVAGQTIVLIADVIAVERGYPCHPGSDRWQPEPTPNGGRPAYTTARPLITKEENDG